VYSFYNGVTITYNTAEQFWERIPINQTACPDPNQPPAPLTPRDSGYTIGVVQTAGGGDRLLLLGGDAGENNVYYSDDCGRTFLCYDGVPSEDPNQAWDARGFAPIVHPVGVFGSVMDPPGYDPVFMMGGAVDEAIVSIGIFYAKTGIDDWTRPPCDGPAQDCCQQPNGVWYLCLPDPFVWPGMVAADSSKLYVFYNETVVSQSPATWGQSWAREPGSAWGSYGRRVWVRGTDAYPGAGCWFSTDFSPADMWLQNQGFSRNPVNSSNGFATAPAAGGPWTQLAAPWSPRASAAVVASANGQVVYVGGGMTFQDGYPSGTFFGDVWTVDSTVCLLTADGVFCNGHGTPDGDSVTCACQPAWAGDSLCGSCGVNYAGADCELCQPGYYGPACTACSTCSVHGTCSGSGTQGGTGKCVCTSGWSGPDCNTPGSQSPAPNPSGAPPPGPSGGGGNAAGTSGLSPAGAAGVSFLVIGLAAAAGLWVFVAKFGGGPTVARAVDSAKSAGASLVARITTPRAGGSASAAASPRAGGERTSLLSSPRAAAYSQETAMARFAK
jgi:hypothetical protein